MTLVKKLAAGSIWFAQPVAEKKLARRPTGTMPTAQRLVVVAAGAVVFELIVAAVERKFGLHD